MKKVIVSQRIDLIETYGEYRDSLDKRWIEFLLETNACGIPIPNNIENLKEMVEHINPEGIVLTGGDNDIRYGGNYLIRDLVDYFLISYAIKKNIPLIGVCKGMQSIALYFDNDLEPILHHINKKHLIKGHVNRKVNSYHSLSIKKINKSFKILAKCNDGSIEAIKHKSKNIYGIMWHPEREKKFKKEDIYFFRNIWKGY